MSLLTYTLLSQIPETTYQNSLIELTDIGQANTYWLSKSSSLSRDTEIIFRNFVNSISIGILTKIEYMKTQDFTTQDIAFELDRSIGMINSTAQKFFDNSRTYDEARMDTQKRFTAFNQQLDSPLQFEPFNVTDVLKSAGVDYVGKWIEEKYGKKWGLTFEFAFNSIDAQVPLNGTISMKDRITYGLAETTLAMAVTEVLTLYNPLALEAWVIIEGSRKIRNVAFSVEQSVNQCAMDDRSIEFYNTIAQLDGSPNFQASKMLGLGVVKILKVPGDSLNYVSETLNLGYSLLINELKIPSEQVSLITQRTLKLLAEQSPHFDGDIYKN